MDAAPFQLEITTDAPAAFHAPPCSGSLDLRLGDCMEGMKTFPDGHFDLAIVDPPYGIGIVSQFKKTTESKRSMMRGMNGITGSEWDSATPDGQYFEELRRVSKRQIIWGGNYFTENLPPSGGWVTWEKGVPDGMSLSQCELAWTNCRNSVRHIRLLWAGYKKCEESERMHPTQKPVKLYDWLLANFAKPGDRILDTHMGSGSIAIACHYRGHSLTACEIDADYFHAAKARIARETSRAELFSPHNA